MQKFNMKSYETMDQELRNLVSHDTYRISSPDGMVYICTTCHGALKSNKCPAQAKANGMELDKIPKELKDLNGLELHLICRRNTLHEVN